MGDFAKRVKTNSLVSALLCAVLGLVLLIWPGTAINVLNTLLGIVLAVVGGVDIVMFLAGRDNSLYGVSRLVVGVVLAVFGIWVMVRPGLLAIIIPRVIGALICVHGIADVGSAITLHRSDDSKWSAALIMGLLTVALGAVLIFKPMGSFKTVLRFIGAFLLYDGISDAWIVSRINKTLKQMKSDAEAAAGALDVDFRDLTETDSPESEIRKKP